MVHGSYDGVLVALSIVIAIAASLTALDLVGRFLVANGKGGRTWLAAAAAAMGGGIWSMHFVGMLAFRMPMPVVYDVGWTALSLAVPIAVSGLGFVIALRGASRLGVVLGGLVMGTGICAMHYIGMSAMRMAAEISYDPGLVALSYAIAAAAAIAALRLSLTTMNLWQRVAGACAMGVAIAGMHYTGMAAATFVAVDRAGPAAGLSYLDQMNLALAVSVTTFLVLFLASAGSMVDRRMAAREAAVLRAGEERYRKLYEALQHETAQRERAEAALLQVQRMEAVGQLTGGIAHDFNNILTVVMGNLDSLARRLPDDEALRRMAMAASRGAERAAHLTQRLLAFGRRQTLAPQTISINRLILGTSDVLSRTLGESIAIETILPAQIWTCSVDPNQLEAALINLALNARDAMPEGGRLRIQTANMHFDQSYAARYDAIEPGDYVMIALSDTGVGIPKENIGRVFEPFFTTKQVGRGSGLGLAQVYGFVRQSGGHVTVYSEVGVGDDGSPLPPPRRRGDARRGRAARRSRRGGPARPPRREGPRGRGRRRRPGPHRGAARGARLRDRGGRRRDGRARRPAQRPRGRPPLHRHRPAGNERDGARGGGAPAPAAAQGALHHRLRRDRPLR
jgi:NO-binding membrane sensor protein with MHYT domain/nitrogen-specific signal transduction histidine kinase